MAEHSDTILAMIRSGEKMRIRQQALLILLHRKATDEPARQIKELADDLRVSKPDVTRHANALEVRGFVRRSHFGVDHRTCVLTLTPAGVRFVARMADGFPSTTKKGKRT
jgi:DNA-binding MarR family transcriptional regulator